jgi:branched-subunit amino acid aminotransferase/4-amino-4-deoxychorismate lyase
MSKIVILKSGSNAHLNPLHSGFAHGFGLFETIKLSGGRLEFWEAHYERLSHSAKVFDLHFDQTEAAILAAIRELVQSEKLCDGVVKLSLLDAGADSFCYVYTRPIELPDENVTLQFSRQSSLNENSVLAGHKIHGSSVFEAVG